MAPAWCRDRAFCATVRRRDCATCPASEAARWTISTAALIDLFATEPRVGVLEASRRLGVARGTVQARLDKLAATRRHHRLGARALARGARLPGDGVPDPRDPAGLRGGHDTVAGHLAAIPEVLEAYTITGAGDMWCRVVARSNADLQRVIDPVLARPAIVRSSTVIALATQVPYRVLPLVSALGASGLTAQAKIMQARRRVGRRSRPAARRSSSRLRPARCAGRAGSPCPRR